MISAPGLRPPTRTRTALAWASSWRVFYVMFWAAASTLLQVGLGERVSQWFGF